MDSFQFRSNTFMTILIIGAGLAGLTCARHLQQHNIDVQVLEASDDVGGRVRSDHVDGYTLDRGFQVLFDQYPAVRRNLDLNALDLQPFEPGAIICRNGKRSVLADPLRDRNRRDVLEAALTPAIPFADKLRTLRLALTLRDRDSDQNAEPDTQRSDDYLRTEGFSEQTIDRFFRPFFGGVFLDRSLETTAAALRFYFRMLNTGQTALPANGIGAITQQLASPLRAEGRVRCHAPVAALLRAEGRVVGVRLDNGEALHADAVVLATDAPSATRLADLPTPQGVRQTAAIYFAGTHQIYTSRKIVLNAAPDAFVNNAQLLSNVAPLYAPPNRHLLSAAVVGMPDMSDVELVVAAMRDLRRMWQGDQQAQHALDTYYPLRVYRIRYAQFRQPPGIYAALPVNRTTQPGLFVAAEWTDASSINGAMTSGERCASLVREELHSRA
jgi:phytoene dehydrogenase-like protein